MVEVSEAAELLSPLIIDADELKRMARLRRDENEFVSINASEESDYFAKGWVLQTPGTNRVRLRRLKSHHMMLEDRVGAFYTV